MEFTIGDYIAEESTGKVYQVEKVLGGTSAITTLQLKGYPNNMILTVRKSSPGKRVYETTIWVHDGWHRVSPEVVLEQLNI